MIGYTARQLVSQYYKNVNLIHRRNTHTNNILLNKRTGTIEDIREIDGLIYAKIKDSESQWKYIWRVNPTDFQFVVPDVKKGDSVRFDVNDLNYAINLIGTRLTCPSSYLSVNNQIDTWKQPEVDPNPLTVSIPDIVLGLATTRTNVPSTSESELHDNVQYIWTEHSEVHSQQEQEEENVPSMSNIDEYEDEDNNNDEPERRSKINFEE